MLERPLFGAPKHPLAQLGVLVQPPSPELDAQRVPWVSPARARLERTLRRIVPPPPGGRRGRVVSACVVAARSAGPTAAPRCARHDASLTGRGSGMCLLHDVVPGSSSRASSQSRTAFRASSTEAVVSTNCSDPLRSRDWVMRARRTRGEPPSTQARRTSMPARAVASTATSSSATGKMIRR